MADQRACSAPARGPDALAHLHPAVRAWFCERFGGPTEPQWRTWPLLQAGQHVLLAAPTGSGKTLAAFLVAIDGVVRESGARTTAGGAGGAPDVAPPAAASAREQAPVPGPPTAPSSARPRRRRAAGRSGEGVRVLYISPLRALDNDVHRNLQEPLAGIAAAAARLGDPEIRLPTAAVRTGDTSAAERRRLLRHPPDILITTPETLFLLLTSTRARQALATVRTVIVDEIHAIAGGKRGTHLAVSLERLDRLCAAGPAGRPPQRLGLSATQRPLDVVAAFLGGPHPVRVVDCTAPRALRLCVSVPVADFREMPGDSVWDSIAPLVLEDVLAHRTTAVFVPHRGSAEMLTRRLNALAGGEVCRAHHGSLAREAREAAEAALKRGELRAICATGTLELGIDVGAIEHVVMVGSPGSAARGLQRIGRSGHAVGGTPAGRLVCRTPLEVLDAAVCSRDMCRGQIEPVRIPRGCLDVLAQHLVSMAASAEWTPADALRLVRGALPYRDLGSADLDAVLAMVSGRLPAGARPGLPTVVTWDRARGVFAGRPGARRAVGLGVGTIPDRGMFAAIGPDGQRVGELDEEFVHESRRGDVFVLGTTPWRIVGITADRVLVVPSAGALPRLPFWHGEAAGRHYALGREMLSLLGQAEAHPEDGWWAATAAECRLDPAAAVALRRLVADQTAAGCLPTDRRLPLEWYRDPVGDVRLAVHAPFGRGVTGPWAVALRSLVRRDFGLPADVVAADNGILLRVACPPGAEPPVDLLTRWTPAALERALTDELPRTSLFAARFRECAGRALLLARGGERRRLPLWLQRLQASDLLAAVGRDFPVAREAVRECLEDHFDLPAWREVLEDLAAGRLRPVVRPRPGPSPFAAELEFRFKAAALYRPDTPRAERAAVGDAEPDPGYARRAEAALAARLAGGAARDATELYDRLLRVGPLRVDEVAERDLLRELRAAGRAVAEAGWAVADADAAGWAAARSGDGTSRGELLLRWAASVPALTAADVRARYGWAVPDLAGLGLERLPDGRWSHPTVRRLVRRRALALARADVAPVPRGVFAEFVRRRQAGAEAGEVLARLQGVCLPLRAWLDVVLPAKLATFRLADIERLVNRGELLWVARGSEVAFYRRTDHPRLAAAAAPPPPGLLPPGVALWFADVQAATGLAAQELDLALRGAAAAGAASNDSLEPLLVAAGPRRRAAGARWWALPPSRAEPEAWAEQLLARYGVVSRALWAAAGAPVPWAAATEALTGAGARRGYFVRGLGGLQFARGADVDRLRETRPSGATVVAGLDPACVWREAARRPGCFVVSVDGAPALTVAGSGRRVRPLRALGEAELAQAVAALRDIPSRRGRVEVAVWDGAPVFERGQAAAALEAAGFARGPTSLRWRVGGR